MSGYSEKAEYRQSFFSSAWYATVQRIFNLSLILFICFFLVRIFEFTMVPAKGIAGKNLGFIFFNDLYFIFSLAGIMLLPSFLLALIYKDAMKAFVVFIYALQLIAHVIFTIYFYETKVPLGSDVFGYSYSDILLTVKASGGVSIVSVIAFLLVAVLFAVLLIFFSRRINIIRKKLSFFLILSVSYILLFSFKSSIIEDFDNEYEYYFTANKSALFFSSCIDHFKNMKGDFPFSDDRLYYLASSEDSSRFVDPEYPFLKTVTGGNTLGPFFEMKVSERPDLVFVILESMGSAYSGKNAALGSFTPFLDSLAKQGLSWENALSAGGRTFAVIPSVFGSLPFLRQGYLEEGDAAPSSNSLMKILSCYGYKSSFYYGSKSSFDKMDVFLNRHGVTVGVDEDTFGNGYQRLPAGESGFSWGYSDKDLFRKYFTLPSSSEPDLKIFLTVANHSPFRIPGQQKYEQMVTSRMHHLGLTAEKSKFLMPYIRQLSCVMYTDDAVRDFFTEYSKRPEFSNTVFVITGDHRMTEIPLVTMIDRFHVPLIIYSPLIKRPASFKSVVTHFDITPTLLALLKPTGVKQPELCHWMGTLLDTSAVFSSRRKIPLMRNKNELLDFLSKEHYLAGDKLYRIQPDFDLEEDQSEIKLSQVREYFNTFKSNNNKVQQNKKIIPDSLLRCF